MELLERLGLRRVLIMAASALVTGLLALVIVRPDARYDATALVILDPFSGSDVSEFSMSPVIDDFRFVLESDATAQVVETAIESEGAELVADPFVAATGDGRTIEVSASASTSDGADAAVRVGTEHALAELRQREISAIDARLDATSRALDGVTPGGDEDAALRSALAQDLIEREAITSFGTTPFASVDVEKGSTLQAVAVIFLIATAIGTAVGLAVLRLGRPSTSGRAELDDDVVHDDVDDPEYGDDEYDFDEYDDDEYDFDDEDDQATVITSAAAD